MNIYFKFKRAFACLMIHDRKPLMLSEPLISFSFDDAPDSAFINGRNILSKYGYRGTYYISLGLRKENNPEKSYFNRSHLKDVIEEGGELACHTYNHIHLYTTGKRQVIADLNENQRQIEELIPGYRFTNFSYPYGEQSLRAKVLIRNKFRSARSVKAGINKSPVDLNNLKALQLEKNLTLEKAFAYIEQTIARKGWLIFYTHDVQEDFSTWGCSPQYFEQVVKYCSEKRLNVQTIEKGLNLINPTQ